MSEMVKDLMNLDKPVLTEKLAPKLAPFAKIVYIIGLVIIAIALLLALKLLLVGDFTVFLLVLIGVVAEFALLRMFCEYLAAATPKANQ